MQLGLYKRATEIYNRCVKDCISSAWICYGDAFHALCASLMEQGKFILAQRKWKEAREHCPDHHEIEMQVQKHEAYQEVRKESSPGATVNVISNDVMDG